MIDFAALEAAWRSSANNPTAAATRYLAEDLAATMKRRRVALDRTLIFAGVALGLWLIRVLYDVAMRRGDPIDLAGEWAVVPLLALPVVLLVIMLKLRRRDVRLPDAQTPLAEGFRAALSENAASMRRMAMIAAGQLLAAPLLAAALMQLGTSGKMAPHEQLSAAVVLGGGLFAGMVFVAVRYFTELVPERRHLTNLVKQYTS
jgi:ferric-dicitrate binding protein FerR (iron transport regulator)